MGRKLKHCVKYNVYKDYIVDPIDHEIFGKIRSFIIDGERYYSSTDIARSIVNKKTAHTLAYNAMHRFDEDIHEYVMYKIPGSKYKSRLRVVSAENAIIVSAGINLPRARMLLKWLLRQLKEDSWNHYYSD